MLLLPVKIVKVFKENKMMNEIKEYLKVLEFDIEENDDVLPTRK